MLPILVFTKSETFRIQKCLKGPAQLLPLKMPITGKVIRERMDNNGYLEGRSKDELVMWARKFVVDDAVWRGIVILPTSRCEWQRTIKRGVGVCEAKALKQYETPFWAKNLSSLSLRKGKLAKDRGDSKVLMAPEKYCTSLA